MGIADNISPELSAALKDYGRFLESDDFERGKVIESSDTPTLVGLADAVDPLFDEINRTLDRLVAAAHPLPENDESLEEDLNSLAQAAMEARMEADQR